MYLLEYAFLSKTSFVDKIDKSNKFVFDKFDKSTKATNVGKAMHYTQFWLKGMIDFGQLPGLVLHKGLLYP